MSVLHVRPGDVHNHGAHTQIVAATAKLAVELNSCIADYTYTNMAACIFVRSGMQGFLGIWPNISVISGGVVQSRDRSNKRTRYVFAGVHAPLGIL